MAATAVPKVKKAAKVAEHPKYIDMISQAIGALKERTGSSRIAILKYIIANFNGLGAESSINAHLKMALKAGVTKGTLKQSKGTGASGSFKLGEKPKAAKKPKVAKKPVKAKKPAAKKPVKKVKTPKKAAKKPAKTAASKSPKKVKKAKTPKKEAKKPVAKKTAAKKAAAKKPAAKKIAAKKSAAKKPAKK